MASINIKKQEETPLMKQYNAIKAVHPDAILLFRVGDFYETYGEDAVISSGILGITLTKRSNGAAGNIELAGFPYHAIDAYMPKLVRAGKRVAICEQLEDPKLVKGLVKRGVIELVTPGVILDNNILERKENSYLAAVYFGRDNIGVAFLDVSTGEFFVGQGDEKYIDKLISNLSPKEIVYQRGYEEQFVAAFGKDHYTYRLDDWVFSYDVNTDKLCKQFGVTTLKGFGVDGMRSAISAAGAILYYLEFTEHKNIAHIFSISRLDPQEYVWIDKFTTRNLELFHSFGNENSSFVKVIDRTLTPMGGRLLHRWIAMPIMDISKITARQDVVTAFVLDREFSDMVGENIAAISDLERITSRIATMRVLPRELIQLKSSLLSIATLQNSLRNSDVKVFKNIATTIDPLTEVTARLEHDLNPDPATNQIQKGGIIASGVNAELDELREIATHGKDVLRTIEQRESEQTGIPSLKIGYTNVFGYYIEVRNTHKDKVPASWIRKQTLTAAERYITPELKEYEQKILGAESRILELESSIYNDIVTFVGNYIRQLQADAHIVANIDCLHSFATLAIERNYCRPQLDNSTKIELKAARHPVIEMLMKVGETYIPNDITLDSDDCQIIMLTGPNMSGKSALLRQTALIVLMAQMGCFVPAASAKIGIVDKIFTRVGASDNISEGESTFMVEMLESASILNNISNRSLVLLDEIGRGTSTYDGISIAWAMVEYLHNHRTAHPRTLFATHYHELNEMERVCGRVRNYHISVKEVGSTIVFLRKLERGGTEHSFGIHVARLAGMPATIVDRATEMLKALERTYSNSNIAPTDKLRQRKKRIDVSASELADIAQSSAAQQTMQLSMFQLEDPVLIQIRDQIKGIDINSLTPLESLNKLNEIKKISGI